MTKMGQLVALLSPLSEETIERIINAMRKGGHSGYAIYLVKTAADCVRAKRERGL